MIMIDILRALRALRGERLFIKLRQLDYIEQPLGRSMFLIGIANRVFSDGD
jgi:hypothetical protein